MASTVSAYSMNNMQLMNSTQASSVVMKADCHQMSEVVGDTTNCCSESCHCFSGSCISFFVLLLNVNKDISLSNSPLKISFSNALIQSYSPVSLYKPPIVS